MAAITALVCIVESPKDYHRSEDPMSQKKPKKQVVHPKPLHTLFANSASVST